MKNKNSLGARLLAAKNPEDIKNFLTEGKSYEFAAARTQRRWKRLASRRLDALASPTPEPPAQASAHKGGNKKQFKKKS